MNFYEVINSKQNRTVIEIGKLLEKKYRDEMGVFRFDGVKLLEEAIKNRLVLTHVLLQQSRAEEILELIRSRLGAGAIADTTRILVLSDDVFGKFSEEKAPQGVITVAKYIDKIEKNATIYNSNNFSVDIGEQILLLESVRDPSNLGAVIRTAAAFGTDRLILSADCADVYNPRTVRAAMGTLFNQHIDYVESLTQTIGALKRSGRRVLAATLNTDAMRLDGNALQIGDCVVIGNEGHGLSQACIDACGQSVFIPMSERAESLNAAVAASILIWELSKLRT